MLIVNACNQLPPLPRALENHWWLNNSFYHRPFNCRPPSDETRWFPPLCASRLCSQPLAAACFQTAGGVCSCSALCPLTACESGSKLLFFIYFFLFLPNAKRNALDRWRPQLWLCFRRIFGSITDLLTLTTTVSVECWSNSASIATRRSFLLIR